MCSPRSVAIYSHVAREVRQWTAATILPPPPLLLPLLLLLLLSLLSSTYSSSSAATRQAVRWLHDLGVQEACSGELSMIGAPENEWVYQRVSLTLIFLFWGFILVGAVRRILQILHSLECIQNQITACWTHAGVKYFVTRWTAYNCYAVTHLSKDMIWK